MMLFAAADPMDHVMDSYDWHLWEGMHIHLPQIWIGDFRIGISKYQILMVLAALLIAAIYIPLAKKIQSGESPKGKWWNFFESILTFIRNDVAEPCLGHHSADAMVPYLWTVFLFILFCNLLGMFPFMGSPTA